MKFQEIAARFDRWPSGTDSFKALAKDCFELMKGDRENAGIYFVAGTAARSFVMRYEDQGLTPDFTETSKQRMQGLLDQLVVGLASDPIDRLRILGEVAFEYEWVVTSF